MYITIIICVLFICATILGCYWVKIGFDGDETLETKFDAIKIKIDNITKKQIDANLKDKDYLVTKDNYKDVLDEIKQILEL